MIEKRVSVSIHLKSGADPQLSNPAPPESPRAGHLPQCCRLPVFPLPASAYSQADRTGKTWASAGSLELEVPDPWMNEIITHRTAPLGGEGIFMNR